MAEAASALAGLGRLELRRGDYPAAQAALAKRSAFTNAPTGGGAARHAEHAGRRLAASAIQGAIRELEWSDSVAVAAGADAPHGRDALGRGRPLAPGSTRPDAERAIANQPGGSSRQAARPRSRGAEVLAIIALARDDSTSGGPARRPSACSRPRAMCGAPRSHGSLWPRSGGATAKSPRPAASSPSPLRSSPAQAMRCRCRGVGQAGHAGDQSASPGRGELPRDGLRRIEGRTAPGDGLAAALGLAGAIAAQGATDAAVRELRSRSMRWRSRAGPSSCRNAAPLSVRQARAMRGWPFWNGSRASRSRVPSERAARAREMAEPWRWVGLPQPAEPATSW
jgi:hypothetical protein